MFNKMANSVAPDVMALYESSHPEPHCLHRLYWSTRAKCHMTVFSVHLTRNSHTIHGF